jgi:hypothetical protein
MNHLMPCMGSAIGATSTDDLDVFTRDLANNIFQCAADRSLVFLFGPPAEVSAVVGDNQLNAPKVVSQQVPKLQSQQRRRGGVQSW